MKPHQITKLRLRLNYCKNEENDDSRILEDDLDQNN